MGGERTPLGRGEESTFVRGVKLVDFWAPFACVATEAFCWALKTDSAPVLVELADPTS